MNKSQMIDAIMAKRPQDFPSRAAAERIFNSVITIIGDELASTGSVTIVNFGSFTVSERAARQMISPRDGSTVIVPAHKTVTFRPGTALKKKLN